MAFCNNLLSRLISGTRPFSDDILLRLSICSESKSYTRKCCSLKQPIYVSKPLCLISVKHFSKISPYKIYPNDQLCIASARGVRFDSTSGILRRSIFIWRLLLMWCLLLRLLLLVHLRIAGRTSSCWLRPIHGLGRRIPIRIQRRRRHRTCRTAVCLWSTRAGLTLRIAV